VNTPTRADLLGYVLGALDADEHRQVEQCLQAFPDLQLEIQKLKSRNEAIQSALAVPAALPAGLARRTCEQIARRSRLMQQPASRSEAHTAEQVASPSSEPSAPMQRGPRRKIESVALVCLAAVIGAILGPALMHMSAPVSAGTISSSAIAAKPYSRPRPFVAPRLETDGERLVSVTFIPDEPDSVDSYALFALSKLWEDQEVSETDGLLVDVDLPRRLSDTNSFDLEPQWVSNCDIQQSIRFISQ
jgi:hypothetical protein